MFKRLRLILKFGTSENGKQIITIHVLPSISRSKENQIMKFGQLMEYIMRNIFLQNQTQNVVEKLVPDLLLKK